MLRYFFLILIICVVFSESKGQTVDLRFNEFQYNNQLSSTTATSITQDSLGFMWIGTTNGLNRFDGYNIKRYLTSDERNYGVSQSNINLLYSDLQGRLWIGLDGLLCLYDIGSDSIEVFSSEEEPRGLKSSFVARFEESFDGILYASDLNSIYYFDEEKLMFTEIFNVEHGQISAFFIDNEGFIWISAINQNRIVRYNRKSKEYVNIEIPENEDFQGDLTAIEEKGEFIWLGTDGSGMWRFHPQTGELKNYSTDNEYARNVREIYLDNEGYLWVIDFSGLKLYVADRDFFQGYYHDSSQEFTPLPHINTVFHDRDNNYWTLHSPGGVSFSPEPLNIARFDSHIDSPFRLTVDPITAISEDASGNLWMGNAYNGIDVFEWSKGRTTSYFHDENNPSSLGKGAVLNLYHDSKQQMWVGTYWGGLQRFRPKTNDFETFVNDPDNEYSISSNDVRSIAEDHDGFLWVCTHGTGVDKFDPQTETFVNYNAKNNKLANDYAFDITVDSNNSVWVATVWGLSVLHQGETEFVNYYSVEDDSNSLLSNRINTVFVDNSGQVWIGSNDGLNLYLPETNNFTAYTDGFKNKNIRSINSDIDGNIWAGTANGLSMLDIQNNRVVNLSKQSGLVSNEFLALSVFNNGDNALFFGTLHGINYFNPSTLNFNDNPPSVYITGLQVLNNDVNNHNSSSIIDKNIVVENSITLEHQHKRIEFVFTAINYINPENNSFAYYLEGFESDWNYAGNKREAVYTNLNPGRYTFRVKAANNQGFWNEEGASLTVIVKAPFWKTTWFKILVVLFFVFVFYVMGKIRDAHNERIKKELEQKVAERTIRIEKQRNELQKQKEELEETNRLKNNFINILAHDLRSPVYSLVQLTDLLKDKAIDGNEPIESKFIEMIVRSTRVTYNLLEDLLIWGRSKSGNIEFNFEDTDLYESVQHIIKGFSLLAESKNIEIVNAVHESTSVYVDKNSLKVVLRNMISNALKFSYQNSQIIINAEIKEDGIVVSIADQGVGMSEALIERLLGKEEIIQSGKGTLGEEGSGLGITLCKDLLKQNNGKMWIESKKGEGTTLYFSLPQTSKS